MRELTIAVALSIVVSSLIAFVIWRDIVSGNRWQ